MLSRLAWRWQSATSTYRNHRMFHQSLTRLDKHSANAVTHESDLKIDNESESTMIPTIQSASNSYELLNVVSKNVKRFSAQQTLAALKTLFELQKQPNTSINPTDIARNSDFERLCRSLKRNARFMELNDVIEALKIVSFVGTRANSEITMTLLNLIKHQINDVTLGHITFLSFLLRRMESNPLVEALHLALPVLLQIQIGTKIDYENVSQLTDLLTFVSRYRVNDQCIMNIVNALTLHGTDLSVEQAQSVVWSLSTTFLPVYNSKCNKLLENAINVLKRNVDELDFIAVNTALKKMTDKYITDPEKFVKFYDETFYNKCADYVVMKDLGFENAVFIQRELNKLSFVNVKLLKYMLREGEKYSSLIIDGKPISLVTLVTAMSQANYKPDNWEKIQSLIVQSSLVKKNKRVELPLIKFSLELLSLGIECPQLWDRIFNDSYLKIVLMKEKNYRLLRTLELYQHIKVMTDYDLDGRIDEKYLIEAKSLMLSLVEQPMQQYLEFSFGGPSFVYTKVRTHLGHMIDHVIAFDKATMEPIQIADGANYDVSYEDIAIDVTTKDYIAVISFPRQCYCINIPILRGIYDMKLRMYEKMGIKVVAINHSTWNELLDREKIPYIQREVRLKLTQQQSISVECQ